MALSPEDEEAPAAAPSTTSLYEEEIVDDSLVEEEVDEDDEEVVEDDDDDEEEFDEESVEEEFVEATEGDVEDQQEYTDREYEPEKPRELAPMASKPEKPLPAPRSGWYWNTCLLLFLVMGAGAGLGYWVSTLSGDDVSILQNVTRTDPPTMAPSTSLSTDFDPVQGNCNFNGVADPSPIDQCDCSGRITDLASDIRSRYSYNREYFIPEVVPGFSEDISSCDPLNQALVWVSSGDDTKITDDERTKRFVLAATFASLGGGKWTNNTNWLADGDYCEWYGITCSDSSEIKSLELSSNNLVGTVSCSLWYSSCCFSFFMHISTHLFFVFVLPDPI